MHADPVAAALARAGEVRAPADRPRQRRCQERAGASAHVFARLAGPPQLREPDHGDGMIAYTGHASVIETPYEMWDAFGPYSEVVDARAFADSLARADLDVPLVIAHDQTRRIARTTNGTLRLSVDEVGLAVDAWLDMADIDVAYIVPKLRAGLIDEMSFAFRIDEGVWSPDFTEYRILRADIHRGDVAIVGWGANPHTDAGLRAQQSAPRKRGRDLIPERDLAAPARLI